MIRTFPGTSQIIINSSEYEENMKTLNGQTYFKYGYTKKKLIIAYPKITTSQIAHRLFSNYLK